MARARGIKPGFYKDERLADCSVLARHIAPGLWMLADRDGRLEDRPKRIKAELLPYDAADVDVLLSELADCGHIVRYRVGDAAYIQVVNFLRHQKPHRNESSSAIPAPPNPEDFVPRSEPLGPRSEALATTERADPGGATFAGDQAIDNPGLAPRPEGLPTMAGSAPASSLIPSSLIPSSPLTPGGGTAAVDAFVASYATHPLQEEVRRYIVHRLPHLDRRNASEVTRWLEHGADPGTDIYPTVDMLVALKGKDIGSFAFFTRAVLSAVEAKAEAMEQHKRLRSKYENG